MVSCSSLSSQDTQSADGGNAATPPVRIKIGVDTSLPRFAMPGVNNSKDLSGFDIDLMKAIASKTGLSIVFVNVSFDQIIPLLGQCQLDGAISAIAITDLLKEQVDFTDPYFSTTQLLVVKNGNIAITGLDSLPGMTVGVMAGGSPGENEINRIPGAEIKPYASFFLAFQDLISGYIDAVIADKPYAISYVEKKPNNLKVVGNEFGSANYGIAICKNRPDLLEKFNRGLALSTADGTLKKLSQKWIKF
jgi:ABC-type amino acid transport substrate-binding protein